MTSADQAALISSRLQVIGEIYGMASLPAAGADPEVLPGGGDGRQGGGERSHEIF